jgi:ribosome-dependent ATPase
MTDPVISSEPYCPPVIKIEGLKHAYGKKLAVDGIELNIPAGCRVGFIGPDGVGKSTLLGIIAGLRKIQTGNVHVLGGDMRSANHRLSVCSQIAYMPQGLGQNLYATLSVFENVDFFGRLFGFTRKEREDRIHRLLAATRLAPFAARPAGKLSGGMKQKLGLCCALIHDPELLILDEPTTGVDPLSRRQFWELVGDISQHLQGMSILVATAYMEEAEHLDWLVMMDDGKILAAGTPGELKVRTDQKNIEDAYIALLPAEKRLGHRAFTIPPRIPSDEGAAIEARNLTKRFGDFAAVDDVSFNIPRGEIFGFLGSNGCGKTTTMKMLTGLLPPTEGEAFLFGKTIEAGSIELRKRLGYMSQLFSLYGELTVRQNLELHAHLFDLPASEIAGRVAEMVDQFDLKDVLDDQAERLPLGIRQRLSLAVAVIHEPEILILDEPTSGVDPVARDHFWELIIKISREHNVTIFVTTHYMNEAGRCDRVALMSMGKVLACDTPAELIRTRGSANLEEAFIAYMQDDMQQETETPVSEPAVQSAQAVMQTSQSRRQRRNFDIHRLAALARRETIELLRDPVRLITSFIVAPILLIVFGYGISTDIENVRFSTIDYDQTPMSRSYIESFSSSHYFSEQPPLQSLKSMDQHFQKLDYTLVIEIPPGFQKDMKLNRPPTVGVWIDGKVPFRAEIAKNFTEAAHLGYLADILKDSPLSPANLPVQVETRYWYNQLVQSRYSIVPGLLATVLMLVPAMLTAVGVVREKELGSIANLYASPITRSEFLWGKQAPYIVLSLISFIILVAVMLFLFKVPFKGSLSALLLGVVLYIVTSTGLGLLISTVTKTQIAALVAAFVVTMIPSVAFSGLLTPVSAMTGGAKIMSVYFPARYFLNISVGTFTKSVGFSSLMQNYVILVIMYFVIYAMSVMLLKKQDK